MERRLGVTEARSRLGAIVDKVQYQGDTVVLEKHGKPAVAVIPYALFEQFRRQRDAAYQVVLDVQRQNEDLELSEDQLLDLIDEAVHTVRKQAKREPSGRAR